MSGEPNDMVITGIGMRTAVGQAATQSCASLRAGINRFVRWEHFAATVGEDEVTLSASPVTPDLGDQPWVDKFESLAMQPFHEAAAMAGLPISSLTHASGSGRRMRVGLCLGVPSNDRGLEEATLRAFGEEIGEGFVFPIEFDQVEIIPADHAAGLAACHRAAEMLDAERLDVCLIGGVDSLLDGEYLFDLLEQGRLLTEVTPAGLIPGEAAAFAVLESRRHAERRDARPIARVSKPHLDREPHRGGEEPTTGEALSRVLAAAIPDARCRPASIGRVVSDLNGERWRFMELGFADARVMRGMPPDWQVIHPADCFGDVGAASGVAAICVAARALQRGYAHGEAVPVCSSSVDGARAAACVSL